MRSRHKEWQNGRGGKWSTRIIWFEEGDGENIRLELLDCEREQNLYPKTKDAADQIWFMFKQGSPTDGQKVAFVADLIELLKKGKVID